jgi:hypothetical protein
MKQSTLEKISQFAYSYPATILNTYQLASQVMGKVYGHFVECGVAAGAQIAAMKAALEDNHHHKAIYAFDSYEGIPLACEKDEQQPGIGAIAHDPTTPERDRLVSSGVTVHDVDSVKRNLTNLGLGLDNIFFIKGWFQDTLPEWADKIEAISLLRLDGDLYESTLVCLRYLYNKVSPGGVIIIDDYALPGCKKAVDEFFTSSGMPLPEIVPVEYAHGPVYFIKPEEHQSKSESLPKVTEPIFDASLYNEEFFEWHLKHAHEYSMRNMEWLLEEYPHIQDVIDFGCGIGSYLLAASKKIDVFWGIDIGYEQARKYIDPEILPFIHQGDCCEEQNIFNADLILCIETAEHIPPSKSEQLVRNLVRNTTEYGMIIFSAAPPGQQGTGHINCQPKSFWIELFDKYGAYVHNEDTEKIKSAWLSQGCPQYIHDNLLVLKVVDKF